MITEQTVQALGEHIQHMLGQRFDAGDLERLQQNVRGKLEQAEVLRTTQIENGAEPDFVFRAHRGGN